MTPVRPTLDRGYTRCATDERAPRPRYAVPTSRRRSVLELDAASRRAIAGRDAERFAELLIAHHPTAQHERRSEDAQHRRGAAGGHDLDRHVDANHSISELDAQHRA